MRSLLACILILGVPVPVHAQHLGDRQQWQPQTEHDPRLQQRVDLEVIGRAAVTGLPILSDKTGVSLSVAPEDLATVGERKFSVIAKELELKSIMVQLCEALQECHWDVDASGPEPTYCLHRNSGAEQLVALSARGQDFREWERTQERLRMLEAARRALQMSPEELDELEKTDVILARLVRFAPLRGMVEGLFSLPPDRIEELLSRGRLIIDYQDAPARLQEAVHLFSRYAGDDPVRFDQERAEREWPTSFQAWIFYDLQFAAISFGLHVGAARDSGAGESFGIGCPPGRDRTTGRGLPWQYLLLATGTPDEETAYQQLKECEERAEQARKQQKEEQEARRRAELRDPALQQTIDLDEEADLVFSRIPQLIAEATGFSVISDYFTPSPDSVPDEVWQPLPVWRVLDLIAEDSGYPWRKTGQCLIFHHLRWYDMVAREIPEHLIIAYRRKLDEQGQFTLEDAASLAAAMAKAPEENVPRDLQGAGLLPRPAFGLFSFFRAPISPEQLTEARSSDGLSYQDMTPAQQQQLAKILKSSGDYSVADFEDVTFAIRESSDKGGTTVELIVGLWRDSEGPAISSGDSFRLPRREQDDSPNASAEQAP